MIRCNKIEKTIRLSQKLVDRLDLNNIDQGFVTKTTKLNHWNSGGFQPKGNSNTNSVKYEKSYIDIYIDRYSLIQMRCKWVRRASVEYYRFLSLFSTLMRGFTSLHQPHGLSLTTAAPQRQPHSLTPNSPLLLQTKRGESVFYAEECLACFLHQSQA